MEDTGTETELEIPQTERDDPFYPHPALCQPHSVKSEPRGQNRGGRDRLYRMRH